MRELDPRRMKKKIKKKKWNVGLGHA